MRAGGALGMDTLAGSSGLAAGNLGTAAVLYAGLAALFVSLGAGSVLTRRWVRPLVLYVASLWILAGVLLLVVVGGIAATGILSGVAGDSDVDSPIGTLGPLGSPAIVRAPRRRPCTLYIILPAAVLWFHRRPALRTRSSGRSVPRWTDHCPRRS
jgi:hypothetical protein